MTDQDIKDIKDRWEAGTMPLRLDSIEGAEDLAIAYRIYKQAENHITSMVDALERSDEAPK